MEIVGCVKLQKSHSLMGTSIGILTLPCPSCEAQLCFFTSLVLSSDICKMGIMLKGCCTDEMRGPFTGAHQRAGPMVTDGSRMLSPSRVLGTDEKRVTCKGFSGKIADMCISQETAALLENY